MRSTGLPNPGSTPSRRLAAPEALETSANRPTAATPPSACFHELIASLPSEVPSSTQTLDQLTGRVADKSLSHKAWRGAVASQPQSIDNGNTSASQLFLGNTAVKSFTEQSYVKRVAIRTALIIQKRKLPHVPESPESRRAGIGRPDRCDPRRHPKPDLERVAHRQQADEPRPGQGGRC